MNERNCECEIQYSTVQYQSHTRISTRTHTRTRTQTELKLRLRPKLTGLPLPSNLATRISPAEATQSVAYSNTPQILPTFIG